MGDGQGAENLDVPAPRHPDPARQINRCPSRRAAAAGWYCNAIATTGSPSTRPCRFGGSSRHTVNVRGYDARDVYLDICLVSYALKGENCCPSTRLKLP